MVAVRMVGDRCRDTAAHVRLRVMAEGIQLRATEGDIRRRVATVAEGHRTVAGRRMAADHHTAVVVDRTAAVVEDMGAKFTLVCFPA
jgi:serine acetyltransferase